MPVFIITDRTGQQRKLIASSLSEARQQAAAQLQQPSVLLQVRQIDTGGQGDQQAFAQLPVPAVEQSQLASVDPALDVQRARTERQVDPIAGRVTTGRLARDGDNRTPFTDVLSSRNLGAAGRTQEEQVDTGGVSPSSAIPSSIAGRITGTTPEGGTRFSAQGQQQQQGSTPGKFVFRFTRPNGSQVEVIAASEEEARTILLSRGDIGPNVVAQLENVGTVDASTPSGLFSDNAGQMQGSGGGGQPAPIPNDPATTPFQSGPAGEIGSQFDRELARPDAAFRNFLRQQGVAPGGIGGSLLTPLQPIASNVFGGLSELGLLPEGTPFSDFLGSGTIGRPRLSQLAQGALNDPNVQFQGDVFGPQGTFTDAAAQLAGLASIAGGTNFGFGFRPTIGQVEQQLQDRAVAGQDLSPTQFLDLLRQQFRRPLTPGSNPQLQQQIGL